MQKRKHAHIIADRAAAFARFANCGQLAEKAAATYAENLYNTGASGANAICQGFKLAKRWKAQGIGRINNRTAAFRQRYSHIYQ